MGDGQARNINWPTALGTYLDSIDYNKSVLIIIYGTSFFCTGFPQKELFIPLIFIDHACNLAKLLVYCLSILDRRHQNIEMKSRRYWDKSNFKTI